MKVQRNLSGIYMSYQNPETKKWEYWCFEDLPHQEQMNILASYDSQAVLRLAIILADKLNDIGDQLNLIAE